MEPTNIWGNDFCKIKMENNHFPFMIKFILLYGGVVVGRIQLAKINRAKKGRKEGCLAL